MSTEPGRPGKHGGGSVLISFAAFQLNVSLREENHINRAEVGRMFHDPQKNFQALLNVLIASGLKANSEKVT